MTAQWDDLELEDHDLPRATGAEVFSLSDMEIDEISFVHRGANPAAHIVLAKSDEREPDPEDVALGYTISRYGVSLPAAEAAVRQHFGKSTRSGQSRQAAYSTASSRVMAEELADKLRQNSPSLTREQAVARAYEDNPALYAAELRASTLHSQRQTHTGDGARRFS
jgi:hypothetical protein